MGSLPFWNRRTSYRGGLIDGATGGPGASARKVNAESPSHEYTRPGEKIRPSVHATTPNPVPGSFGPAASDSGGDACTPHPPFTFNASMFCKPPR